MSDAVDGLVARYQRQLASRNESLPPGLMGGDVPWADRPYCFSVRQNSVEISLRAEAEGPADAFAALSKVLRGAAGIVGRRLQINWNCSHEEVALSPPRYRRPAASGGGLYPIDIYVVAQGVPGVPDGLLQYCEAHGSLALLRAGAYVGLAAEGCGDEADQAGLYLVLSVQYWRNVFKYQSFGYHVVNFDCGAMFAAVEQTVQDAGGAASLRHLFDDTALASLVGLDPKREAVLGVVAVRLPGAEGHAARVQAAHPGVVDDVAGPLQRSRRVNVPPLTWALHEETCRVAQRSSAGRRLPHVQPPASMTPLARSRARGSVYGQFDPSRPIPFDALGRILKRATSGYCSDLATHEPGHGLIRMFVIALRVAGLDPGVYAINSHGALLGSPVKAPDLARLQSLYYLPNQNVSGCGAVFVAAGLVGEATRRHGARSIRVVNAQAGVAAQRLYAAAGEEGCGGSAALGFNAVEIDLLCGLKGEDETALLLFFAGVTLPDAAFDFRI